MSEQDARPGEADEAAGPSREELRAAVLRAVRHVGSQAALFSQAVAERLGLAGTDVEGLDVLAEEGRLTVGRLAELTGLTTGSATRMVDRLEQAGFVRRVPDPADRRRVLVEPAVEPMGRLAELHRSIEQAQTEVIDRFDDAQLDAIADFLARSVDVARRETAAMRAPTAADDAAAGGSYAAPIGSVVEAQLVFVSGAPNIVIRGEAGLGDLYRARFDGPVPRMRVRGGVVTVAYPRFGWFDWRAHVGEMNVQASVHWRKDRGEILLNSAVPWSIELRGGASRLTADLRQLRLRALAVRGGANRIDVQLPQPLGVVPISLAGGASHIALTRPAGSGATLTIRGGAGRVSVDGERIGGGDRLSLGSPGEAASPDRFEIEIAGGASQVRIETS